MASPDALMEIATDFGMAARSPHTLHRANDGRIEFRRSLLPTADSVPRWRSNLAQWIGVGILGPGAVAALSLAIFGLNPFVEAWATAFETAIVSGRAGWLLLAVGLAAACIAIVRHRRRPQRIVFDPGARAIVFDPGKATPFDRVDGIHALTWMDTTDDDAPVERHRVYLRIGRLRTTLAELDSKAEAQRLAAELRSMVGLVERQP